MLLLVIITLFRNGLLLYVCHKCCLVTLYVLWSTTKFTYIVLYGDYALPCSSSPLLDGLLKQTLEMISIVKNSRNLL